MRRVMHTSEQRWEILERVKSGEQPVSEIAYEYEVSLKTIHNWIRANKVTPGSFIEVPTTPPRATIVELSFADGAALRIRG
jgi:transposase-like protein